MESARIKQTVARWTLVLLITSSSTGCLSLFGIKPHSSLRPRMASLDLGTGSTVRSQDDFSGENSATAEALLRASDGLPSGYSFGVSAVDADTSVSRHRNDVPTHSSAPSARLLMPQFDINRGGTAPANGSNSPGTLVTNDSTNRPATVDHVGSISDRQAGQSLGLTADRLREIMNQQSASSMSQADVLADRQAQWSVVQRGAAVPAAADSQHSLANAKPNGSETAVFPASRVAVQGDVDSAAQTAVPEATGPQEPSMIDRLRGIYGSSSEQGSRSRWRLPSPWSVFRDKEESDAVSAADSSAKPVQTADTAVPLVESPVSAVNPMLQDLIEQMRREISDWPRLANGTYQNRDELARRQQDLRLLYLIADDPGNAISAIDAMSPREQEFWQEAMLGLAQFRSFDGQGQNPEQRITNTVGQFRSAVRKLIPSAALRIRRMDVCSQIYSFGRVETFPSNTFTPGQPILLYVELENFATQSTRDGSYRTSFDARLQFFAEGDDEPIETKDLPEITDEATSERTDYYQSFELNLPSHLNNGDYRIGIQLLDRNSGRTAKGSVQFRIQRVESPGP